MYYGARYYNPKLGRFITPDTIVQTPNNPQTLNRYTYCNNNPVNLVDPTGHSWKKFVQKVSGYIGFVGTLINNTITGDWSHLGQQIAAVAISAVTTYFLPGFGTLSSNLFLNIAAHAAIGAVEGAVIGGITSVIMGGKFAEGARLGAIGGAIGGGLQGITTSQQYQNWQEGNGFISNREVTFRKNTDRVWVGYGKEQWENLDISKLYAYSNNSKIDFVGNPSWGDYEAALQNNYRKVLLHTHADLSGTEIGLRFSDGLHSLSELKPIAANINTRVVGISSCFPRVQSEAWAALKITNTTYVDLSAVSRFSSGFFSNSTAGSENVYHEAFK